MTDRREVLKKLKDQSLYSTGSGVHFSTEEARVIMNEIDRYKRILVSMDGDLVEYELRGLFINLPPFVDPVDFGKGGFFLEELIQHVEDLGGTIGGWPDLLKTEEQNDE